jgi:hypothetical protein
MKKYLLQQSPAKQAMSGAEQGGRLVLKRSEAQHLPGRTTNPCWASRSASAPAYGTDRLLRKKQGSLLTGL